MWKHCRVLPFDSCKLYESNQNNLPSLGMCKIILATNYHPFFKYPTTYGYNPDQKQDQKLKDAIKNLQRYMTP